MREILFRGKRIDNGEWIEGFYCTYKFDNIRPVAKRHYIMPLWTNHENEVDPTTVGQYTGLTDKNGKRIFEGDILQYKNETCWVINWCAEETRFVVTGYIDGKKCEHICIDTVFRDFEVIGNIHDNPDLVEGAD
jgi:uncharacterized phage protein (TIGR01671 family)